jgi:hemoglobin
MKTSPLQSLGFSLTAFAALALLSPLSAPALAAPSPEASTPSAPPALCPVSGKPANPAITAEYEGATYVFADEACRKTFMQARENSLYHKLGGRAAMEAAIDLFYTKVLADNRINHFFADINMNKQRRKQKEFLSAALGGPIPYVGKDLRKAHAHLPKLNDSHFDAVAENLQKTLEELKLPAELISQVMEVAASTRNAVLNRPDGAAK